MSEADDDMIQAYIKKVLKIQQEQKERPLDAEELRQIAEELGMSEDDLKYLQKKIQDYIARGKGYSRYEDWDSAIDEFQQALILSPNDLEALYGLANAYKHRWLLRGDKEALHKAKQYVKQALNVSPTHDPSFRLASELNRGNFRPSHQLNESPTRLKSKNLAVNKLKELLDEADTIRFDSGKRLRKSILDKKIFGVCGGIAEYFGIDPTWVRIAFILGIPITSGFSIVFYIILALLLPKE